MRSIAWALTTSSFLAHHLSFIFRSSTPTGVVVPAASAAASVTTRAIAIGSNYHRNFQQPKQRLLSSRKRNSNKQEMSNDPSNLYTTNEEDQRKAAALQARLKNRTSAKQRDSSPPTDDLRVPSVEIAEGAHKYVLIKAVDPYNGDEQYFVTSRKGAHYHRNAAEPMIAKLEEAGYEDMEVTGGGRIDLNVAAKTCRIFGFSYSFGLANHAISQRLIRADPRYRDFEITISDDGY